jgi:hypothetical protein
MGWKRPLRCHLRLRWRVRGRRADGGGLGRGGSRRSDGRARSRTACSSASLSYGHLISSPYIALCGGRTPRPPSSGASWALWASPFWRRRLSRTSPRFRSLTFAMPPARPPMSGLRSTPVAGDPGHARRDARHRACHPPDRPGLSRSGDVRGAGIREGLWRSWHCARGARGRWRRASSRKPWLHTRCNDRCFRAHNLPLRRGMESSQTFEARRSQSPDLIASAGKLEKES